MERVRKVVKGRLWRKVIACFLTCCMFLNTSLPVALADEVPGMIEGEAVLQGTAGFNTAGNTTTITTGGASTIIEYTRFNIDDLRTVNFAQPDASSAVLNRVIGANQSLINGDLISNGRVFLINPAGIMFGSGSTVDVTQLVASGLGMTNEAFNDYIADPVNNKMEFMEGEGKVTNRAAIKADSIFLIGKKVWNLNGIGNKDGLVVMAAGDEVRLLQDGSDVSVVVYTEGDGFAYPDVRNSSNISVDNGKIVLAAGDTLSRAISNVGFLAASGGEVEIQAALIENRGAIDTSIYYPVGADGDGGSISLTGTEQVVIGESNTGGTGEMHADAGVNGNGGTITINAPGTEDVDGKVIIGENSLITANGGSESGNGGTVAITSDDFEIAGDIDASFGNKMSGDIISEPGKLEITSRSVTIADGANLGAINTIYEEDIEALSQAGTSLIVNAEEGITVKNITDDIGNGEITGQFGNIELHATGVDSAVTFADSTDTIRTTLGDIVIEAGSGGINVGNLTTGKDLSDQKPVPGQIILSTQNGGDITTGDLTIRSGWGHAEINVDSSGDLTVNGEVVVGSESSILNVPLGADAEAEIYLKAANNVVLDGEVKAYAHGIEEGIEGSLTKAYIEITGAGATINSDLVAEAKASNNGTADATIKIETVGDVVFAEGAQAHAIADNGAAEAGPNTESEEETSADGDHAQIIINANVALLPVGVADNFSTSASVPIEIDVLANDTQGGLPLVNGAIDSYTEPTAGTLTPIKQGDVIVSFTYNPPADLSTLTFNENGEATVTFTYTVRDFARNVSLNPTTVTIMISKEIPTPPVGPYIQPVPGLDRMKIEIQTSGCPALVKWVAKEIGIDQRMVQIWMSNSLASTGDIQPCDACAGLKNSAQILQDTDGSYVAALAQVISEFASSNTPPTEEQMASIADAIARNTDEDSNYAVAGEYLDALVTYISVLNNDMGFSAVESVQFVTDKYVGRLAQSNNVGVATFIAASLAALGG